MEKRLQRAKLADAGASSAEILYVDVSLPCEPWKTPATEADLLRRGRKPCDTRAAIDAKNARLRDARKGKA